MKYLLGPDDVEAAVTGGCILGGGGGGLIGPGLARAREALAAGRAELWTVDEFCADSITATVAMVGAPSSSNPLVTSDHLDRSLGMLRERGCPALAAINTNENGAETTLNGWPQSVASGLPVLDLACNGRAHPTGLMGALGLHRQPGYRSLQAFAGGTADRHVAGFVEGSLSGAALVVNRAAVEAGGIVAVARNPVTIGFAARQGAPGAISQAIATGRAFLDAGLKGLEAMVGLETVAEGRIRDLHLVQRDGLDVGHAVLDDPQGSRVDFVNEYLMLARGDARIFFPNLIMLFDERDRPLPSASLVPGIAVKIVVAPQRRLILSQTMRMAELYDPLRHFLDLPPRADADQRDDDDPLRLA